MYNSKTISNQTDDHFNNGKTTANCDFLFNVNGQTV